MGNTAINLIQHFGYVGLGLGLVLSTLGLFSSEVLLLLAGAAWRQGSMQLLPLVAVALAGQLIGGLISHAIGQYGGIPLIEHYGRYVLLSRKDLQRAHDWFGRQGRAATVIGYCLPLIRSYIGYAAGIARQPRRWFALSNLVGSLVWSLALAALGYYLAEHLARIEAIIRPVSYAVAALVAVAVVWFVRHRLQEARA